MTYLEGKKYEKDYGPLNLNRRGKALSYDVYYQRFRKIIHDEMIPIFLKSDDAEVVFLGSFCRSIIFPTYFQTLVHDTVSIIWGF